MIFDQSMIQNSKGPCELIRTYLDADVGDAR